MYGVMVWCQGVRGEKRVRMERRRLIDVEVFWVWVVRGEKTPQKLLNRRLAQGCKLLRKQGVEEVALDLEIDQQVLVEGGLRPISSVPLRRMLGVKLMEHQLQAQGIAPEEANVVIAGTRMDGQLVQAVKEMTLKWRYVMVDVDGSDGLCQQLRREYGVSVRQRPGRSALHRAHVIALYAPRPDLPALPQMLSLYDQSEPLPTLSWPTTWEMPNRLSPMDVCAMLAGGGRESAKAIDLA